MEEISYVLTAKFDSLSRHRKRKLTIGTGEYTLAAGSQHRMIFDIGLVWRLSQL